MRGVTNTAVVLGSAQDGGVPQLGGAPGPVPRSASSVAVVAASGERILLDASPDLRLQHLALTDVVGPGADPRRPFDAVLLTHAHMGHYAGLVHFGKEALNAVGVPCHATPTMLGFLAANQPWAALFEDGHLAAAELPTGREHVITGGVTTIAHRVAHRPDFSDTVGFELRFPSGAALLYLPDLDGWSGWDGALDALERVDVALVDATFFDADEHPARDLSLVPHPSVSATVEFLADIARRTRVILTHLNWTNPLCDPVSAQTRMVQAAGFDVARDGMRIDL